MPAADNLPWVSFATPYVDDDDIASVTRVLRSGWLTTGDECAALEDDLAGWLGAPHVVSLSSCTAALEIMFAHLDLPAGARVGVPSWTFVASALAPVHHGAVPVLLDVDPDDLNVAPEALAAALDQGLDAVVAVHFGGVGVAPAIHELCTHHGVPLVEDAAHALGTVDHRGLVRGQGSVGAAYSFYATKNLTSAEGGALATDDPELAAFARSYRLHGMSADASARYKPGGTPLYDLIGPGYKMNLPDLLAALARSQFAKFDAMQGRRRSIVLAYRSALADVDGLRFVPAEHVPGSADHLAVVLLPEDTDRAGVIEAMKAEHVSTSVHFRPLHHFGWFERNAELGPAGVKVAESLGPRALSLPLHPGLSEGDVERVVDALRRALRR